MYLGLRGDLASSTLDEHGRTLRYLKEYFGDDQVIGKITPLRARQFISWYRQREHRGKTLSAATANKLIRECRRIFREAVDCQLLRGNPFATIPQEKVGQAAWHLISVEEFGQLLESCPSLRWRGMITLGYCCGLGLGEVLHLTWSDIDFEKGLLRIARKRSGADGPEWTPKDKDMRLLPLPATARSARPGITISRSVLTSWVKPGRLSRLSCRIEGDHE